MAEYITKDSGEREQFDTGAKRDTRTGKGRFDLLTPIAIRRVAGVYERGADKYGDHNWQKGMPISRYVDSALRHLFDYMEGKRDEDHLGQAMWNVMAAIHTEEMVERGLYPAELNDMRSYLPETPSKEEMLKFLREVGNSPVEEVRGGLIPSDENMFIGDAGIPS